MIYFVKMNLFKLFEVYEFAKEAHEGQFRKTGEPYMSHPIAVAKIARKHGADESTIYACLLHDVVEDTNVSLKEIIDKFGEEVAFLVDGVTKVEGDKLATLQKAREYAEIDERVGLIKLADRCHNISIPVYSLEWRRNYSKSTEFYINLGKGLGLGNLVNKLERLNKKFVK